MSITFRRAAEEPRSNAQVARMPNPTVRSVSGAVAGAATGVALGAGGAAMMPAIGLPIFLAMGLFFGLFNGGLIGLITHPVQRR